MSSKFMNSLLNIAMDEAHKSDHESFKHGAVLVHGKDVLSTGCNKSLHKNNIFHSLHAEMCAIKNFKKTRLKKKPTNLRMYVIRVNKTGDMLYSKPCDICQQIMKENGIYTCYYSKNDGYLDSIIL